MPAPLADGGAGNARRSQEQDAAQQKQEAAATPKAGSTQKFEVTPDTVVGLATEFYQGAKDLEGELRTAREELRLHAPLLGDPASQWMADRHNEYWVDGPASYLSMYTEFQKNLMDMYESLVNAAKEYGKTEQLNEEILRIQQSQQDS